MLLPSAARTPDGMDRFDDFLVGHWRLPRPELHLVNNRSTATPASFLFCVGAGLTGNEIDSKWVEIVIRGLIVLIVKWGPMAVLPAC
jgi:hypothetical protein